MDNKIRNSRVIAVTVNRYATKHLYVTLPSHGIGLCILNYLWVHTASPEISTARTTFWGRDG